MSDKRFEKVYSDPRFMVAPKKVSKVKIDKRFEGMFNKKEFNVVAKVDKYGRRVEQKDTHALQNYYKQDSSGSEKDGDEEGEDEDASDSGSSSENNPEVEVEKKDEGSGSEAGKKYYDSNGKFHWTGDSSEGSDTEEKEQLARK